MRYPACEKLEIIQLVIEHSAFAGAPHPGERLGIPRATFSIAGMICIALAGPMP